MKAYVSKVIKVAEGEVGYLEKRSDQKLNAKTENAGSLNYTKYGKWYGYNGPSAYWCAMFVSWCFTKAYGSVTAKSLLHGGPSASCEVLRTRFKKADRYHAHSPKKGDLIFFSGSRHAGANHIGIVYKVDGGKVYTIEGNTSSASGVIDNGGAVAKKSYATSSASIMGYGRPKYDSETTEKKATINPIKSIKIKKKYDGNFPALPSRGYFKSGDSGNDVKRLQKFLNWYGNYGLKVDGVVGDNTIKAVMKFQKAVGISVDGKFGKTSLAKAKAVKK